MDIKQDEISTLHELCVDKEKLLKSVSDAANERPVSVIMPMLYREIKSDALKNIIKGLNKCTYLNEIIIPLAAKNEREFRQVKRFFSDLKIPNLYEKSTEIRNLILLRLIPYYYIKEFGF